MARIIVIDDNDDVCEVITHILESAGHQVARAADGAQGLELLRKSPAALVITDILMPDKDGIETIHDLKREFPDLRIIAMSGAGRLSADERTRRWTGECSDAPAQLDGVPVRSQDQTPKSVHA